MNLEESHYLQAAECQAPHRLCLPLVCIHVPVLINAAVYSVSHVCYRPVLLMYADRSFLNSSAQTPSPTCLAYYTIHHCKQATLDNSASMKFGKSTINYIDNNGVFRANLWMEECTERGQLFELPFPLSHPLQKCGTKICHGKSAPPDLLAAAAGQI